MTGLQNSYRTGNPEFKAVIQGTWSKGNINLTYKHENILSYFYSTNINLVSIWKNISCLQTIRGATHLEISTWQDCRTYMELRVNNRNCSKNTCLNLLCKVHKGKVRYLGHKNMKTWKIEYMKIYSILLFYLYNSMSLWFNISCLGTVSGGRQV